jgi:exonuclease V
VQEQAGGRPVDDDRTAQRFLHISDAKTRDSPTVPSERNSKQARTQLMLYHRLLSGLVQPSSDLELKANHLDFDVFWLRVGVDPYEPFSDGFCEQTGLSAYGAVAHISKQQGSPVVNGDTKQTQFCLNTLVDVWKKSIHLLGIASVDPTLTLNYRRRTTSGRRKRRRMDKTQGQTMSSLEDKELDQAIIASLVQADRDDPSLTYAIAESLRDTGATGNEIPEKIPLHSSGSPPKRDADLDSDELEVNSGKGAEEGRDQESELIGSVSFVMEDAILDARLEKVLEWWHGIRLPEGVELEDTGRCQYVFLPLVVQRLADLLERSSCEFSTSCEWREKKHNELLSKLLSRTQDVWDTNDTVDLSEQLG